MPRNNQKLANPEDTFLDIQSRSTRKTGLLRSKRLLPRRTSSITTKQRI